MSTCDSISSAPTPKQMEFVAPSIKFGRRKLHPFWCQSNFGDTVVQLSECDSLTLTLVSCNWYRGLSLAVTSLSSGAALGLGVGEILRSGERLAPLSLWGSEGGGGDCESQSELLLSLRAPESSTGVSSPPVSADLDNRLRLLYVWNKKLHKYSQDLYKQYQYQTFPPFASLHNILTSS